MRRAVGVTARARSLHSDVRDFLASIPTGLLWRAWACFWILSLHCAAQDPFLQPSGVPVVTVPEAEILAPVEKRVQILPRSGTMPQAEFFPSADGRERIAVINAGVNIIIDGVPGLGTVDIATDRLVIWTSSAVDAIGMGGGLGDETVPLEFYMEGNVVFRQADRVIHAASMYYNVTHDQGVILNAELLAPVTDYQGVVRLKAAVLRQVDRNQFQAFNAAVSTSRMGIPRYWFQTQELSFVDTTPEGIGGILNTGPLDLPYSGMPPRGERRVTSRNNSVYLAGIPIFWWPVLTTDFTRPTTYVNRVRFGSDRVFGQHIGATLDMDQILALGSTYPNFDWDASIDYFSKRGWGFGTHFDYLTDRCLFIPGQTQGFFDAWGIDDHGLDNLGADRRMLVPEKDLRGRVLWRNRQWIESGWQASTELGVISDRNFLESFFEQEWDQEKDQVTGTEFKRLLGTTSWNLAAYFQLNDFFTQTSWWPRLDHYELGRELFGDQATWLGHSQAGYARMHAADPPKDPVDLATWNPLAWEADVEGIRIGGRHELDFPMQLGMVKVVPYVLGDAMHWGEDLDRDAVTRLYGQTGVRASLPMWRVDPTVQNLLFNLNGLAHKITWEAEFLFANADRNLDIFPLYDPLDDDAIEAFRRRFVDDIFGGTPGVPDFVPRKFDERFFALRTGMQSWVTAPSAEIADDLMLVRLGAQQRWQTKRGVPGRFRTVDWMTLNVGGTMFPKPDRDNFGSAAGLLNYDWRWHLGDRFTLASDGFADVFDDGLRTVTLGGFITRPERGSLYLGVRSIEGPLSSNVLNTAVNYRMSPKWIGTIGSSVDLGPTGNIGQILEITRVGESFLVTLGGTIDESRDNIGIGIMIEPRFMPLTQRSRVGGVPIPPAGYYGLE